MKISIFHSHKKMLIINVTITATVIKSSKKKKEQSCITTSTHQEVFLNSEFTYK